MSSAISQWHGKLPALYPPTPKEREDIVNVPGSCAHVLIDGGVEALIL